MSYLLPNQERARWVVIIFYIHIASILAFALSQWWQAGLIESGDLTTETAQQSDLIVGVLALAFVGTLILCIVFFIMWFRRAYANLHRLGNPESVLSFSEGWASGAWFVPFLNLVRPYHIMKEIWNETQYNIPGKVEQEGLRGAELIGWWWGTWIVSNILSNIASKMGGERTMDEIITTLHASAIGECLAIPAAFLAIRVVQETNIFEQELYNAQILSDPSEHLLA